MGISEKIPKWAIINRQSKITLLAVLIIAVCGAVAAAHWSALSAKALSFDDSQYMTQNPLVQNPSWASAKRFLTEILKPSTVDGYYQPLAMISLMFDYALGGRENNLMPFHRTSLILHIANTALVIILLYLLFGSAWAATAAGLLFGVHPMTVEPVTWIGERKTLLAAFFSLWSLVLYVRYAQGTISNCRMSNVDGRLSESQIPNLKSPIVNIQSAIMYAFCLLAYILALISKPTSTMLPAVMLLFDFWPLRRLSKKTVFEKLPFFILGGCSAVITYISQNCTAGGTTSPIWIGLSRAPLIVCYNIVFYLSKILWPINLSSHYAFPDPFSLTNPQVLAGIIGTCGLIPLLLISLRRTRGALTGWLIFFVLISPTIQIFRFSKVVTSDKFAYLASIGLLMAIASFLVWFYNIRTAEKSALRRRMMIIIVLALAFAEAAAAGNYLEYWQDSVRLFSRMLTLSPNSPTALYNLANVLFKQNRPDEAIDLYQRAIKIQPDYADAYIDLGTAFERQGRLDEAIDCYRQALRLTPDSAIIYYNIGNALRLTGTTEEAVSYYRRALQLKPDYIDARNNLGLCLQSQKKYDEAIEQFHKAMEINPRFTNVYNNIGNTLWMQDKLDEAAGYFRQASKLCPDCIEPHCNLGSILILQGKLDEAVSQFRQALQIKPDFIEAHINLGDVLVKQGAFDEAFSRYRQAVRIRPDWPLPLNKMITLLTEQPQLKGRYANATVDLAEHAAGLSKYKDAAVLGTLASAYAAAGRFDEAVKTSETALSLALSGKNDKLTAQIRKDLELYKQQDGK